MGSLLSSVKKKLKGFWLKVISIFLVEGNDGDSMPRLFEEQNMEDHP